ncbi:MAG TPA: hypothetical protein DCP28_35815, partial [Cytophagales bacterium]|nr:hypothetical protein [Cytophagales bacterium]
ATEDTVRFSFRIGQWGAETSAVSLLTPTEDWVINRTTDSVNFTVGEYDVYEIESTLERIELQYRAANITEWSVIESVTQTTLALHDTLTRTSANDPVSYIFTWKPSGLTEGSYAVRAVAYGDYGFPEYSGTLGGTVDATNLWLVHVTPEDSTVTTGDAITLTFSEAIAPESIVGGKDFKLQEQVITESVFEPGTYITEYFDVDSANWQVEISGDQLTIYFDQDFTNVYDGASLQLSLSGATDAHGNDLDTTYEQVFEVIYDAAADPTSRMGILDLAGTQLEDGSIGLTWSQYDAEHTQGYLLERSLDGEAFELVTLVMARGESEYSYQEKVRFTNHIYYRVRVQRNDGSEVYSRVATIQDAGFFQDLTLEVYPNPIEGRKVQYTWHSQNTEESTVIRIRDLRGMLLHTESVEPSTIGLQQSVKLPEHLQPGLYLLQIEQGTDLQTVRFMLQ